MRVDPSADAVKNERISESALKYFTDRTEFIDSFLHWLNQSVQEPLQVLVFYGVGGIGKTTLVRKLGQDLDEAKPPFPSTSPPHARFDLESLKDPIQAYREVLVGLSAQLKVFHVKFPRFDLCLSLMLASEGGVSPNLVKLDPSLNRAYQFALSLSSLALPLTPVSVGVSALATLGGHIAHKATEHYPELEKWVRHAGGTAEIIELRRRAHDNDQTLPDELIRRFAEDLKEGLPPRAGHACQGVLFLDSHERLWLDREADRSAQAQRLDAWLRKLAAYCLGCGVLPVISGRDRLPWDEDKDDPDEWAGCLDQHLMGGLSAHDAQAFLFKCGIGPDAKEKPSNLQSAIIQCCNEQTHPAADASCHTLFLALCAEIVLNTRRQSQIDPPLETFRGIPPGSEAKELANRFLMSLHSRAMEMWLEQLSLTPRFDETAALAVWGDTINQEAEAAWEMLTSFSFATPQPDGFWRLHETMRDALRPRVPQERKSGQRRRIASEVHTLLHDHWAARGDVALAFFHRWSLDPDGTRNEWTQQHETALKERRIADARRLLSFWSDISLDEADRHTLGDKAWAETHLAVGNALWGTAIAPRAAVLIAAIEHFEAALRVYTEPDFPQQWAMTQSNLGSAYLNLPTGDRGRNLAQAVACYQAALRVRTEADFPQDWAMTQNNLGSAYLILPTGDRGRNLAQAVAYYQAALRVRTEADFPQDWAMTQSNLGIAYGDLPTGDRGRNLAQAVAYYQAALRVRTEADFPQDWAMTQSNLGNAYLILPTGDRGRNLAQAVACYQAALRVYTEPDFPQDWAMTQNNLGSTYLILPTGDRGRNLAQAVACYQAALRVYTEPDFPQQWAATQNNLGNTYGDLPTGDRGRNLAQAVACYQAALRVYTEPDFPQQWATTQNNLGIAYGDLPTGDRGRNLAQAVAYYQAALRVRTEADFPQDWAMTQNNLGSAYLDLPTGDRGRNLAQAVACYQAALRVYTEPDFPQDWARTQYNLGLVYISLAQETQELQGLIAARECFEAAARGYAAIGIDDEAADAASMRRQIEAVILQIKEISVQEEGEEDEEAE